MATPALLAGYHLGVAEARAGSIPEDDLYAIAESYAKDLGEHYNEVSTQAMLEGFQAQVNRKLPAARAARAVADAYGVPPRAMNTLVAIWNTEDPKRLSKLPLDVVRDVRAKVFIDSHLQNRAGQIGESEAWAAKSQAKQIVWMYGMQKGIIPQDARRTWVTAKDEKVCQYCGPLNRATTPVGETFKTAKGELWVPPMHVNCRCDVILDFANTRAVVRKDAPGDPYDRDRNGRFASTERRGKPTISRLYQEMHVPSITQDIQRQLEEAAKQPERMALPKLTKLEGMKLGSMKLESLSLKKQPLETQQLQGQKLQSFALPKMKLDQLTKQRMAQVLYTLAADPAPVEDLDVDEPSKWEIAEFPIAVVRPKYEVGPQGDFILNENETGISLGDRVFGGEDILYEQIQNYWNEEIGDYLDNAAEHDSGTFVVLTDENGDEWVTDRPDMEQVLEEAVHGIARPNTAHINIWKYDDPDEQKLIPASHAVDYLGLENWVEDNKPVVVILRHVNKERHELRGQKWHVPGSYRTITTANDLPNLHGSDLPMEAYYVEPAD